MVKIKLLILLAQRYASMYPSPFPPFNVERTYGDYEDILNFNVVQG
jgi:hypothetical protein